MNQDKSKTMDAAEKLMLDLIASRRVRLLAAGTIPKRRKGKTRCAASNRRPFY